MPPVREPPVRSLLPLHRRNAEAESLTAPTTTQAMPSRTTPSAHSAPRVAPPGARAPCGVRSVSRAARAPALPRARRLNPQQKHWRPRPVASAVANQSLRRREHPPPRSAARPRLPRPATGPARAPRSAPRAPRSAVDAPTPKDKHWGPWLPVGPLVTSAVANQIPGAASTLPRGAPPVRDHYDPPRTGPALSPSPPNPQQEAPGAVAPRGARGGLSPANRRRPNRSARLGSLGAPARGGCSGEPWPAERPGSARGCQARPFPRALPTWPARPIQPCPPPAPVANPTADARRLPPVATRRA